MSQSQSTAAHRPVDSTEACQMDFWHLSADKARKANYLSNLALYVEIDEADPVASAIGHWLIVCTIVSMRRYGRSRADCCRNGV